jgi:flagellar biosynthesis/type III secretory pathway protein FliH
MENRGRREAESVSRSGVVRKEGRKEGRKDRRKEGRKEGIKEGKKEGRKEGRNNNNNNINNHRSNNNNNNHQAVDSKFFVTQMTKMPFARKFTNNRFWHVVAYTYQRDNNGTSIEFN